MQLPNRRQAYIPRRKLTDYLLSDTHAVGRSKAQFFRALGFDETNVTLLEQDLLAIAQNEPVTEVVLSPHGTKYVIDAPLATPSGTVAQIRTVWIIETTTDSPRFVTAYPAQ